MFEKISAKLRGSSPEVCRLVIEVAVEIAREGREGRRIGTLFTIGDADSVLKHSRPLILDPVARHAKRLRSIRKTDLRETLKELAQLDGAFIFDDDGILVAACRYLDARASDIDLPIWDLAAVISRRLLSQRSHTPSPLWYPRARLSEYSKGES